VIELRGREKACEDAAGDPCEHRAIPQGTPKKGRWGAARRLSRGLQLQEPFRLLPLQPALDLGTPYL